MRDVRCRGFSFQRNSTPCNLSGPVRRPFCKRQGCFAGGRSAADDEQIARGRVQVLVQHRDPGWNVLGFFIKAANIVIDQFPDGLKILFFPVERQGFAPSGYTDRAGLQRW